MNIKQTASQTVGPFFHNALIRDGENILVNQHTRGERIWLRGTVMDGEGQVITDAILEIWQADASGIYKHPTDPKHSQADPHFTGFGRAGTDKNGAYWFYTILPSTQATTPYINLRLFMRGLLIHLVTRIYFADHPSDPVLNSLEPSRKSCLIATREDNPDGLTYRFDIHMQGELETVFFDV